MPPRDIVIYNAVIAELRAGTSRKDISKKYNISTHCISVWARGENLCTPGYQARGNKGFETRKKKGKNG